VCGLVCLGLCARVWMSVSWFVCLCVGECVLVCVPVCG